MFVHGVQQKPIEGVSMLYTFNDAHAPDRHETQYFEMLGNRGIYHKGWTAVTKHRTPWVLMTSGLVAFDDDVWELYDTTKDWSQARDLAKEQPEMLHELQRLWLIEAIKYNVLPLDDRRAERFVPEMAGRPSLIKGKSQLFFGGMGRLSENSVVTITIGPATLGLALISIGTVSLVIAVAQHRRTLRALHSSGLASRWSLALTVATLVSVLGVFAFGSLVLNY
jgi:hypothetical protein